MTDVDVQSETRLRQERPAAARWGRAAAESGLIFLVFFLWAGGPPPDTNESHYLAKARHYWDPGWAAGDFFLESADAHVVFYWTFGWVTAWLPLPAAAWVGRIVTWLLLAWSWRRLSWAVVPRTWFAVLSAALFLVLLDWCDLAGEWVVEGVEAKGFAFVFVFLGIEAMVRNRWNAAWLLFGAASAFHVLVGGWTVVAAGFVWLTSRKERPRLAAMLPGLIGGLALSLLGLIPALALTRGVDPEVAAEAHRIYVYLRLKHHLLPSAFPADKYAAHLTLLGVWFVLCLIALRLGASDGAIRRVWGLVAAAVLIALCGLAIELAAGHRPELAAGLLRFYFFRLSDAFIPLGTVLTFGVLLIRLEERAPRLRSLVLIAAMLLAGVGVGIRFIDRQRDFRPGADRQSLPAYDDPRRTEVAYEAWVRATTWVRENTPEDARFLTPRAQQTFKWYAHRPEVVSWKDVPQDAAALVEWRRRFAEIYGTIDNRGLTAHSDATLLDLARKYDAQYILIDRARAVRRLGFERVYPSPPQRNAYYEVYRVPEGVD